MKRQFAAGVKSAKTIEEQDGVKLLVKQSDRLKLKSNHSTRCIPSLPYDRYHLLVALSVSKVGSFCRQLDGESGSWYNCLRIFYNDEGGENSGRVRIDYFIF